jgi:hypothetical protein
MLELLKKSIKDLERPLNNEESAYLAMTSKFENPFRDKLAYSLFTHYKTEKKVCREWSSKEKDVSRVDIAIIKNDESLENMNLIELKATNTQHGYGGFVEEKLLEKKRLNHIRIHVKSLVKKLYFLQQKCNEDNVYGIFIGTHPTERIDERYNMMVKSCYSLPPEKYLKENYENDMKRFISEIEIAYGNTIKEEIQEACTYERKNRPNCKYNFLLHNDRPISLGNFYNTPISLLIYLIECVDA